MDDGGVGGGQVMDGWGRHREAGGANEAFVFSSSCFVGSLGLWPFTYKISKCPFISRVGGFARSEHILNFLN